MSHTTAQELASFYRNFCSGDVTPPLGEMVSAVRMSSLKKDEDSLEDLLDALMESYVRLNPDKPKNIMIRNAREAFATLAYFADHNPTTPEHYRSFGPGGAYRQPHQHGPAMTLVKKICDKRQIDLDALYREFGK